MIQKAFRANLVQGKNPLHHEVLNALERYPLLKERGIKKVKYKIKNDIRRNKLNQKVY